MQDVEEHIDLVTQRQLWFFFGTVIFLIGGLMVLPALLEFALEGEAHHAFEMSAIFTMIFGGLMALSMWSREFGRMNLRHAFLLIGGLWLIVPGVAAIPLVGYGMTPVDALFEMASGFTTTGSTVLTDLDREAEGVLLWRAMSQWMGGIGIVVMSIFILPFLRIGGMQLFRVESWEGTEKVFAHAGSMIGGIVGIYLTFSLLCMVAYAAGGMTFFDAILHAMTTVSTGGYSSHDASFGYYSSPFLQWTCIVFMVLGSLPFLFFMKMMAREHRGPLKDSQVEFFLLSVILISLLSAFWLALDQQIGYLTALRLTAFNVVSVVSTTGFATTDYTLWGPGAVMLFFLLTLVGGCAGSTAGGIKAYRLVILSKLIRVRLWKLETPNRVAPIRFNDGPVEEDTIVSILSFLTMFTVSVLAGALLLSFTGLDFITALSAATTAICNVGPGIGDIVGPAGNFESLSSFAKLVLSFLMILGRLEIFTVLILFSPGFWTR